MKVIQFIKSHTPYVEGDIAGFDDKLAAQFKTLGVAIDHDSKKTFDEVKEEIKEKEEVIQKEVNDRKRNKMVTKVEVVSK